MTIILPQWIRLHDLNDTQHSAAERLAKLVGSPTDKYRMLGDYIETGMVWKQQGLRGAEDFAHSLNPIEDLMDGHDD